MMCPGQDTQYWTPDDVFDVACQACGRELEFFKSDATRRCPQCGKRIQNPRLSSGCAQWCAYAKECLGFDPKELQLTDSGEVSLVEQLIDAVKQEFGADQERVTRTLLVLDRAQEILRREEGDPRVVLAGALLHDIGIPTAEGKYGAAAAAHHEAEGPAVARRIMEEAGVDETTVDHVCQIVGSHHSGGDIDSPEFRVVWDATRLMEAPEAVSRASEERVQGLIERVFRTETGRLKANKQFEEESDKSADA